MNRMLPNLILALLLLGGLSVARAQDGGWPRTVPIEQGMITIYPPRLDAMEQGVARYRAALAYRPVPGAEPVFGVAWLESRIDVDRGADVVHHRDLRVAQTRFPAGTPDLQPQLAAAVARNSPGWDLDQSLEAFDTALKTAQRDAVSTRGLNTEPPRIIYRDHPALLVNLDGDPVLRPIEGSPYRAVINTPYPLITDGRYFYLNAARDVWYRADHATGPYRFEATPPAAIAAMVQPGEDENPDAVSGEAVTAANAPEIVVATEPAELIVTEGPAVFVPLVDDLLVLQNSDDDVFLDIDSQQFFIVLAGRWYRADSLNGPWEYQEADRLPPAFADIPQDSDQADSRVYVAGTPEAEEAVLDAQLPQATAVKRGAVAIDVTYDGDPEFQPVEGTALEYAVNADATVLHLGRTYFLVENGVWYVSDTPYGPWVVSDHRPREVDDIAPTSPVYNIRYVYIFDSTPDVVYVGYTPGYLGSYVYYDTVVYGTGWYYPPWVSPRYYYPRFATWGFHVGYSSWGGWRFGLSWGWGPFYAGYYTGGYWHRPHYWHPRHHGYWGPAGYRPHPVPYRGGGYAGGRYSHGNDGRYGHGNDGRHRRGNDARHGRGNDGWARGPSHGRIQPLRPVDLRGRARAADESFAVGRDTLREVDGDRGYLTTRPRPYKGAHGNPARKSAGRTGGRRNEPPKAGRHRTMPVRGDRAVALQPRVERRGAPAAAEPVSHRRPPRARSRGYSVNSPPRATPPVRSQQPRGAGVVGQVLRQTQRDRLPQRIARRERPAPRARQERSRKAAPQARRAATRQAAPRAGRQRQARFR